MFKVPSVKRCKMAKYNRSSVYKNSRLAKSVDVGPTDTGDWLNCTLAIFGGGGVQ